MPINPTNVAANWLAIRTIAPDRFDKFKRHGDVDALDAVARYVWNLDLCSALHVPIHILEITFRNQVYNALSSVRARRDWYNDHALLNLNEQTTVIGAKRSLDRLSRPHDPGGVVAELSFGFWTMLYGSHHENDIIRPTIRQVFPNLASPTRAIIAPRLKKARVLRNRVSHHEHVCFDPALAATYREIVETIGWMSPVMAKVTAINDDFIHRFSRSWTYYRATVESVFG